MIYTTQWLIQHEDIKAPNAEDKKLDGQTSIKDFRIWNYMQIIPLALRASAHDIKLPISCQWGCKTWECHEKQIGGILLENGKCNLEGKMQNRNKL